MSELTNVFARNMRDLTTPTSTGADPNTFDSAKIPIGNAPQGFEGTEALTVKQLKDLAAAGRKEELDAINLKINGEVNELESKKANKADVDTALSNLSTTANKFYQTLAEANYYSTTMAVNDVVTVGEEANRGLWYKATAEATTLTKSAYDPLTQAKNYADENAIFNPAYVNSSGVDFNELTKFGFHRFYRGIDWNDSINRPALESQWAMVLVMPVTTGLIGQFVFCFNSGKTAFRYGAGSPLVWRPWVINSDDVEIQNTITANITTNNPMLTPKNISITTGDDFNTLNTHGFNRTVSAAAWDLSTNKPPEVGQWAIIMVLPISATVVFQFVFCINANVLYFRSSTNATTWAAWKKLSGDASVLQSALTAAQAAADTKINELKAQLPSTIDNHLLPKFEITGKNIFDPLSIVLGKTISNTGVITNNKPNGVLSGVIDVVGKTNLYVSGLQPSGGYRAIVFLREDGTVAQVQSIGPNLTEKLFAIPQNGAVKAQMCIKENNDTFTLDTSTIQFEFSATKTEYEPFKRGPLKSIYGVELSSPVKPGERFIKSRAFGASYLLFGDSITETSNVDAGLFDQISYRKNWPTWAVETLQMGTFRNYAKSGAAFKDRSLEPRYQYLYNQISLTLTT